MALENNNNMKKTNKTENIFFTSHKFIKFQKNNDLFKNMIIKNIKNS